MPGEEREERRRPDIVAAAGADVTEIAGAAAAAGLGFPRRGAAATRPRYLGGRRRATGPYRRGSVLAAGGRVVLVVGGATSRNSVLAIFRKQI